MDLLTSPFAAALVVIAILVLPVFRTLRYASNLARGLGGVLLLTGSAMTIWVAIQVANPGDSIVGGTLMADDPPLQVQPGDTPLALLVHGRQEQSNYTTWVTRRYEVTVTQGGEEIDSYTGTLLELVPEELVLPEDKARGSGGGVRARKLEVRHVLPEIDAPIEISAKTNKKYGDTPLTLEVVPAPPPKEPLIAFGVLLVLVGAFLDGRERQQSPQLATTLGMITALCVLLLDGVTPNGGVRGVFGATLTSIVLGLPGGFLAEKVSKKLFEKFRAEKEPTDEPVESD